MLSDSEPDPLDSFSRMIKKVNRGMGEKNETRLRTKTPGRRTSIRNSHDVSPFKLDSDSVEQYVKETHVDPSKSNSGISVKKEELPKSHLLMQERINSCNLKRDETFVKERAETIVARSNNSHEKKDLSLKNAFSDSDDQECSSNSHSSSSSSSTEPGEEVDRYPMRCSFQYKESDNANRDEKSDTDLVSQAELEAQNLKRQEERKAAHLSWCKRKKLELLIKKEKDKKLQLEMQRKKEMESVHKSERSEDFQTWATRKKVTSKMVQVVDSVVQMQRMKKAEQELQSRVQRAEERRKRWEKEKANDALRLKEQKKCLEERSIAMNLQRKQMANEEFNKWLGTVHLKPKPPPLNKGEKSFVVQNIGWINPIPWKSTVEYGSDEGI